MTVKRDMVKGDGGLLDFVRKLEEPRNGLLDFVRKLEEIRREYERTKSVLVLLGETSEERERSADD